MQLQMTSLRCGYLCVGPTDKWGAFTPKVIGEFQETSKANRSTLKDKPTQFALLTRSLHEEKLKYLTHLESLTISHPKVCFSLPCWIALGILMSLFQCNYRGLSPKLSVSTLCSILRLSMVLHTLSRRCLRCCCGCGSVPPLRAGAWKHSWNVYMQPGLTGGASATTSTLLPDQQTPSPQLPWQSTTSADYKEMPTGRLSKSTSFTPYHKQLSLHVPGEYPFLATEITLFL